MNLTLTNEAADGGVAASVRPGAPWTRVCEVADIPLLGSRAVERAGGNLALFRTAPDVVFALLDRCPHKGGPLSQGMVHGNTVTCPLHNWQIALDSGHARTPDEGCVRRFPVRVAAGAVYLDLS